MGVASGAKVNTSVHCNWLEDISDGTGPEGVARSSSHQVVM